MRNHAGSEGTSERYEKQGENVLKFKAIRYPFRLDMEKGKRWPQGSKHGQGCGEI